MKHYIITNRAILKDENGIEYINVDGGEAAGENLRFGSFDSDEYRNTANSRAAVTLYPEVYIADKSETNPTNDVAPYNRADIASPSKELYGSVRAFTELYTEMKGKDGGDLLFFVHGYHSDFVGALESVCRLEDIYINKHSPIKHIVFFTWPAMNKYLRYRDDAKDAELSGFTLARSYLMLIDFFKAIFYNDRNNPPLDPCGHNIHLIAHSMGNRVVENMMVELGKQKGEKITALFKEVILVASDVDWQVFEDPRAFYNLVNICQRVSVYFNTCDLALLFSETTKNAYNRLGKFGFRDFHKVPSHVYSIDCSGIKDQHGLQNKLVDHWYYKESPKAIKDITEVLKGKNAEDFVPGMRTIIPGNALQYRIN